MARRSDHSRDELYEIALTAAWDIAEREGLRGVTGREVARKMGYTVGTLYNLFDNLDDLIGQLIARILGELYDELEGVQFDGEPETVLRALAEAHTRFTYRHPKLWGVLFEHGFNEDRPPPDEHAQIIARLYGLLECALAPFFSAGKEAERLHCARVLWSSFHGIYSLEGMGKLDPGETTAKMADTLITHFLAGLRMESTKALP